MQSVYALSERRDPSRVTKTNDVRRISFYDFRLQILSRFIQMLLNFEIAYFFVADYVTYLSVFKRSLSPLKMNVYVIYF